MTGVVGEWGQVKPRKNLALSSNKENLVDTIRNESAFHYDVEHFLSGLSQTPPNERLEIFVSEFGGNCLYYASDVVANYALFEKIEPGNPELALDRIWVELTKVAGWVSDFAIGCWVLMMERSHKGAPWEYQVESVPATPIDDVKIPFFVKR